MTKFELVDQVWELTGIPKKDAKAVLDAAFSIMEERLSKGEEVNIAGFGVFKIVDRQARKARNPRTGEQISIPAHKVVKFNPAKKIREALRG